MVQIRRLITNVCDLAITVARNITEYAAQLWEIHLQAMEDHTTYREAWTSGLPALLTAFKASPVAYALGCLLIRVHAAAYAPDPVPGTAPAAWTPSRQNPFSEDERDEPPW